MSISIFNLLGQKVATLFEGNQNAGEYNIVWNARQYAIRCLLRQADRRRQDQQYQDGAAEVKILVWSSELIPEAMTTHFLH